MLRLTNRQCKHHVFVCVRNREGDMPCCGAVDGEKIYMTLKAES